MGVTGSVVVPEDLRPAFARRGAAVAALRFVRSLLEQDMPAVAVVALWATFLALSAPFLLVQDSWLAFVDGRLVAAHWLPHVDTLTLWTLGREWTDQQWGAHLVLYELADHGGVPVAIFVAIGCVAAALAVAAVTARRLGASPRSAAVGLMLPLLGAPWLAQVRSQTFALVPFVLVYALLALDARRPRRRVLWVLPLLVVWANLHGSAVLGAGLAALYGGRLTGRRATRRRGLLLLAGSPLVLLASPYALQLVPYYRLMLFHPPLAAFVREWRPPAVGAATAIFFASAFAATALYGAHRARLTSFERWAFPLLLVAALTAVRNAVWFELAAAISVPGLLESVWPSRTAPAPPIRRINLAVSSVALVTAVVVGALAFAHVSGRLDRLLPPADAAAVATAAGPDGIVLADDEHADWLLWLQPSLASRIAYDVRFELFSGRELRELVLLHHASRSVWLRCGRAARVVTFATPGDERAARRERVLAPASRTIVGRPTFVAVAQPVAPNQRCRRV